MADDRGENKRSPVRPTVIEGEAQDVTPEDEAVSEKDSARGDAERAKASEKSQAGKRETPKDGQPIDSGGKEAASGDDESESGENTREKEEALVTGSDEERAASATTSSSRKSRFGWKIFGILLLMGASAGGGIWAWNEYGPMKKLAAMQAQLDGIDALRQKLASLDKKVSTRGTDIEKLQARLAALEKRMNDLENRQKALADAAQGSGKAVLDRLLTRLEADEKRLQKLATTIENGQTVSDNAEKASRKNAQRIASLEKALAEMQTRLSSLSAGLDTLARAGTEAQGGETGGAPASAAVGAMTAVKLAGLEKTVEGLQKRISGLERGAASSAMSETLQKRLQNLNARLNALQKRLHAVDEAASKAGETARNALAAVEALKKAKAEPRPPAIGIAFASLREKVLTGEPFTSELERMKGWLPGVAALDVLRPYADKGIASETKLIRQLQKLAARFAEQRKQALEEARKQGLLGNLKARLGEVVKIRRSDRTDWAEALARARALTQTSGLAAAVRYLQDRPGAMPQEVATWVKAAKARVAAEAALEALSARVLSMIASGAEEQPVQTGKESK